MSPVRRLVHENVLDVEIVVPRARLCECGDERRRGMKGADSRTRVVRHQRG